jgi:hypothetical protein
MGRDCVLYNVAVDTPVGLSGSDCVVLVVGLEGARLLHSRNCPRCSSAVLGWPGTKQPKPNEIITSVRENLRVRATK